MNNESTALVEFQGESVDQFFGFVPMATDWDAVYANVDKIDIRNTLDTIQSYEPLTPGDVNSHAIWVQQQRLRLALRRDSGKSLVNGICPQCGTRPADVVAKRCLWCEEFSSQMPRAGSRGSCGYVLPQYDIQTHTWGIVFYDYISTGEDGVMAWIAKGFSSSMEAQLATYPVALYVKWLDRKYKGIGRFYSLLPDLFDVTWVIKNRRELPYDPKGFETYLRNAISEHMHQPHNLLAWETREAIQEYARNNDR